MKYQNDFDVAYAWRWLLQEILLAKNCHQLDTFLAPSVSKVLLDALLPTISFIRVVSFFDEALSCYIEENKLSTKGYGSTLDARLRLLNDQSRIVYSLNLQNIKDRRNELAHRSRVPETYSELSASWQEVDETVQAVESELQSLGMIGNRPDFEFFWERTSNIYPDEFPLAKPGVRLTHHYCFGVKENGERVTEFKRSFDLYAVGYQPPNSPPISEPE